MKCPYCNTEYTFDDPCFCHAPSRPRTEEESTPYAENPRVSALEPTGLSNPFWST